ncbi:MAG: type II secretion system protein N [Pseudomonadota bacterium]
MATRTSAIVSLLVITLCCIAIVEGGYMALEFLVLRPTVRTLSPEAAPLGMNKADTPKKYGYQVILARNLFAAVPAKESSRLAAFADSLDGLKPTSLGIVLMGTIGDNEGGNRAIIFDKKTLEQQIYRRGQSVQGAMIKEIRRGKVVIALNGLDEILDMSEAAKVRPAQKAGDGSLVGVLQPDTVQAALEKTALGNAGPQVEELLKPPLPGETGSAQSTKRVMRPADSN